MIVGLDQSYTSTGYFVRDGDEVVTFGTFKSDSSKDMYDRAAEVALFVTQLIEVYEPEAVHLEGLAFGIRGNATRDLAGLLYVVITSIRALNKNIIIKVIPPLTNKKKATGNGKASKSDMINAMPEDLRASIKAEGYKLTTGGADIADAYWLSLN